MRIRLSQRLALLAAAGVVTFLLTTPFAGLPASASRAPFLTAQDFHEVALQGFGDPGNSWAWSMEWYNNSLFVGTNRYYNCVEQAALHLQLPNLVSYPPPSPTVQCPSTSPNVSPTVPALVPTLSGEIWAVTPQPGAYVTPDSWKMVYQSPITVPVTVENTAVMGPRDIGFRGMSVFDDGTSGPALYVSGVGLASLPKLGMSVPPPSLLRTTDGVTFQAVPADRGTTLGDVNQIGPSMRGQVSYNGKFYIVMGTQYGYGRVFVSSDPAQGNNSFQPFTPKGMRVFEMAVFNGHLYLGIDTNSGYMVKKFDDAACTTLPCSESAFATIVPAGGGLHTPNSFGINSMHVFTDSSGVPYLYVGSDGVFEHVPAEVIRINTNDQWQLVVGKPRTVGTVRMQPLSGLGGGFGWKYNLEIWRMGDYNGTLYVGTYDQSIKVANRLPASQQKYVGFDLFASTDGIHFTPVTLDGFGDKLALGPRSILDTPDGLFIGSANLNGGLHIWQAR